MKNKPVLLTLLLACAALPVRGNDTPTPYLTPITPARAGEIAPPAALPAADPLAPVPVAAGPEPAPALTAPPRYASVPSATPDPRQAALPRFRSPASPHPKPRP